MSQAQNVIADSNAEVVKALSDIVNTLVAK
jgi:hypothetical protein